MAWLSISASTGLTLPGMIDDPGCTAGSRISSRPVVGPDDSSRKSLAMRVRVIAVVRIAAEKSAASACDCMLSKRSSDVYSVSPVSSLRRCTIRA